jgi:hypothetical protein
MVLAHDVSTVGLAKKLVKGSPWRLTTPYEKTVRHFRFTSDGKVQVDKGVIPLVATCVTVIALFWVQTSWVAPVLNSL